MITSDLAVDQDDEAVFGWGISPYHNRVPDDLDWVWWVALDRLDVDDRWGRPDLLDLDRLDADDR